MMSSENQIHVRAIAPFRGVDRDAADGTSAFVGEGSVAIGDILTVSAARAEQLVGLGLVEVVRQGFTVGAYLGGGYYPILDSDGDQVDSVQGRAEAQARAADLNSADNGAEDSA